MLHAGILRIKWNDPRAVCTELICVPETRSCFHCCWKKQRLELSPPPTAPSRPQRSHPPVPLYSLRTVSSPHIFMITSSTVILTAIDQGKILSCLKINCTGWQVGRRNKKMAFNQLQVKSTVRTVWKLWLNSVAADLEGPTPCFPI